MGNGIDAGDWLAFSGNVVGVILAVAGAWLIEHWSKRADRRTANGELIVALTDLRYNLEACVTVPSLIVGNYSDWLRSPLVSIIGFADQLEEMAPRLRLTHAPAIMRFRQFRSFFLIYREVFITALAEIDSGQFSEADFGQRHPTVRWLIAEIDRLMDKL